MSAEQRFISVISGASTGAAAGFARIGLRIAELAYTPLVAARGVLFDRRIKAVTDLGRPTVSVGNITTGGTGKTPVTQWLTRRLLALGEKPAVLIRGYRSHNGISDEAELLRAPDVEVEANPDRIAGARNVLQRAPHVSVFVLDDGFQHRRAARDFDLVLIDATNPFGFGHLLPRGLLRESPAALRRADAILITHADKSADIDALRSRIRSFAPAAPIFECNHVIRGLIDAAGRPIAPNTIGVCAAVTGIGNPGAFFSGLGHIGVQLIETRTYNDHHRYTATDVAELIELSRSCNRLIVTKKDWMKLQRISGINQLPIARAVLEIDFVDGHASRLMEQIRQSALAAK
ncbi:MAG: tetraacyldisaccharide 4'-kinase [Burkholderiales bacterium]|nr:tetraacyldisaccharide 4'-kinase [Phycisphaerae bacterium]